MSERDIRITGLQAAEWGPSTLKFMIGLIQQVMEEKAGEPMEWVPEFNRDSTVLLPVSRTKPPEPRGAYARIDFHDGHFLLQHLPGEKDRLLRDLVNLVDTFKSYKYVPSLQVAEVEVVKE